MISSRGDNVLEYYGTLISENEESIELSNVDISIMMLMLNFLAVLEGDDSSSRHWTDF